MTEPSPTSIVLRHHRIVALAIAALIIATGSAAHAQDAPAAQPADPPPAAAPAAPTAPPPQPPPPPASAAITLPPLVVGAWGRLGVVVQGTDPSKLDGLSENGEFDLILGGKINKWFSLQANGIATFGPSGPAAGQITGDVSIMDLIAEFGLNDLFNVWVGRMLVPSDRSNFSGTWFMAPWNYPGQYIGFAPPIGPRQGPAGRNDGLTVWGQVGGGKFKYYLGVYDLFDISQSPLFSGRLNLALLDPEPGYLHSSTYYGKNMLNIGLAAQFKKNGSVGPTSVDDYSEINADVLFEKPTPAGVLDLEGAFYGFFGDNEPVTTSFYVLASYEFPTVTGIGKLQPLVRFQGATPKGGGDLFSIVDVQLGYVIDSYASRLALVYSRSDVVGVIGNAITLGVQLQK